MAGMGCGLSITDRVDLVIRLVVLRAFLHGSAAFLRFSYFLSSFLCWRDERRGGGGIQIPSTTLLLLRYYYYQHHYHYYAITVLVFIFFFY